MGTTSSALANAFMLYLKSEDSISQLQYRFRSHKQESSHATIEDFKSRQVSFDSAPISFQ